MPGAVSHSPTAPLPRSAVSCPGLSRAAALPLVPLLWLLQAPGTRVPSRIQGLPGDSISLKKPPLPGGVADMVRRIFDAPQAVQVAAVVVGILVLAGLVAIAWWQRAELLYWFQNRSRRAILAAGALGLVLVGVLGWFSVRSWNYMQHDNDFCSGCHVMAPAWQKFQTTKHAKLSCHQCHQQSLFASARQLVLWVAQRPGAIPAHSTVPNERCIGCHVKGDPRRWKQIAATEGHRLHLESAKLKGLQCVRCHGFSVHQFVPSDMTCGQSGCHTDIRIKLGKMTKVTTLHCAMCHRFTRATAAPMSVRDSIRRWLTPTRGECFSCHEMQKLMVDQQLAHDPHGAVCGACHNPHTQTAATDAVHACAKAGCHARADTLTPLHRGLPGAMLANCTRCHQPHSWKTKGGGECRACHGNMFGTPAPGTRVSAAPAAMPWPRLYVRLVAAMAAPDPVAAFARPVSGEAATRRHLRYRPAREAAAVRRPARLPAPAGDGALQQDTATRRMPGGTTLAGPFRGFSHAIHRGVACTSCHSMQSEHGALLVRTREDCMRCHHSPRVAATCTRCHETQGLPQGLTRTVTSKTSVAPAPTTRSLPFSHRDHPGVACASCHSGPPAYTTIASCTTCHESHHANVRDCRTCHVANVRTGHPIAAAHVTCTGGGCHADPAVRSLTWSRQVCLTCHQEMKAHEPGRFCADCHRVPALRAAVAGRAGGGR